MNIKHWFSLLLAIVPFYLTWTFDHSLWNPDETRDAGIASEMYRNGNYAVPTLNGTAFLEKPPLYYWSCAAIYKLTGHVTAGTTRLPSALYGILGCLFTFLLGQYLFGLRAGVLAAAILATSMQYFRMSHFAMMDIALAAFVTASLYCYQRGALTGFALCTVLAFYTKGFLGIVLPGLVVTFDLLPKRKVKEWFSYVGVGAALFALLALPWFWALWKQGGASYLKIFFIDNHLHRFASSTGDHTEHSFFYYFGSFSGDFLPWTLLLIAVVITIARAPRVYWSQARYRFIIIWFIVLFLFFSVSSSKRSIYLLPLFPAASLLVAAVWDEWLSVGTFPRGIQPVYVVTGSLGLVSALAVCGAALYLTRNIGLSIALLVPLLGLSILLIDGFKRFRYDQASFWLCGLFMATIALSSPAFMQKLDEDKTFVPLTQAIQQHRAGRIVAGFDMSEMERGVIGFYLNETFVNLRTIDELKQQLSVPGQQTLLIVNRNRLNDLAPILEGKTNLVFEYRAHKKTRSYQIYNSL